MMERTEATVKEALTVQLMAGDITKEAAKAKLIRFRAMQAKPAQEQSLALPQEAQTQAPTVGAISGAPQVQAVQQVAEQGEPQGYLSQAADMVMGIPSAIGEMITGNEQSTPEIEAMPYAGSMPEMNQFSMGAAKVGFGTLFTNPKETVEIFRANFPNVAIRQDAKGNYIFKSNIDGKEYGLQPGFGAGDIPRAAATGALAAAAGTGSILSNALAAITIEAGVEGSQALAGGTFNPENVALAGGLGVLGDAAVGGVKDKLIPSIRKMIGRGDDDALRKAAMETPEAFQTAQKQGPLEEVAEEMTDEQMGTLVNKASKGGKKAKKALADEMRINKDSLAEGELLGMEVPIDFYTDSHKVAQSGAVPRAEVESNASSAWRDTVQNSSDVANENLVNLDAIFLNGAPSSSAASDKIKMSLKSSRQGLIDEGEILRKQVDDVVSLSEEVELEAIGNVLNDVIKEVGEGGLSGQEKKMLALINSDEAITYGRLDRERRYIGNALAGKESPYGSMDGADLKRLYGALAADKIANAERIGVRDGVEGLGKLLEDSNHLFSSSFDLGDEIVKHFTKSTDGSIGRKMELALMDASKQGGTYFAEIAEIIPKEMRREVFATLIASATKSKSAKSAIKGGFGFSEYLDFYKGISANPQAFKIISDAMKPEDMKILSALAGFSSKMTRARALVESRATQQKALVNSMAAQGLVEKVLSSTTGKTVATAAAAALTPGGVGAAAIPALSKAVSGKGKKAVVAAGELFSSPEFRELAIASMTKAPNDKAITKLAKSPAFLKFASRADIKNPTQWIMQAVRTQPEDKNK